MQKAPSYVSGTSDAPLLGMTIGQALDLAKANWGEREALVSPSHGVRFTWRDILENPSEVVATLARLLATASADPLRRLR